MCTILSLIVLGFIFKIPIQNAHISPDADDEYVDIDDIRKE